jgi:glycosyltransferase involved in cell wall biosynthesis
VKLVFIITGLSSGGAEAMLFKLNQHLDRSRFEPIIISLTTLGDFGAQFKTLGIPVYALGMMPTFSFLMKFLRLLRLLRELKPDLVHTWMYHADLLGGVAARLVGIGNLVWCIRNSDLSTETSKRSTHIVMKICALLSGWLPKYIITCSTRAASIHVAAGYAGEKFILIPNGFDLLKFKPDVNARDNVRAELGILPGTPIIGLVARDDPQKNHIGFIEAVARAKKFLPKFHFVLVGRGVDCDNQVISSAINYAGLTSDFHLLGDRSDVHRLMAAFDFLVSSSLYGEAFPNVLGEAMACGLPCVATDVGDSAEILGSSEWVVSPGDVDELARVLVKLATLPNEKRIVLGRLARKRVLDCYEIGNVTRRYEELYFRLKQKSCN